MRAFRLAYDGRDYHGFQRQPDVDTVEDALFDTLCDLGVTSPEPRVPPGYAAAGRTDAGVSALAQTIAFEAPPWLTPVVLTEALPADIGAWAQADVSSDFHATHDALERTYEYHLHLRDGAIDPARLDAALARLSGPNDFHNLTPDADGTNRTLSLSLVHEAPFARITATADGFPRQLVRRLIGLAAEIGAGTTDIERIDRVLDPTPVDGPLGVAPAPPSPLVLVDVRYPTVDFEIDPGGAAAVSTAFTERARQRAARARVSETVAERVASASGAER